MQALVGRTQAALLRAVDLLSTEFRIHSWDFLPYEAVLVILCCVCSRLSQFDAAQMKRVRQWFWRSAFSERYRVGGEGFVTRDLDAVTTFITAGGDHTLFGDALSPVQISLTSFRSNNSRSRAFILALAAAKPRSLLSGAVIDTSEALSQFNKKQFHHIYPRAYLKRTGEPADDNVLANICMLTASENNTISDSDPHTYIPALTKARGHEVGAVFASNLMPSVADLDFSTATYGQFTKHRSEILSAFIAELCEGVAHR